MVTNSCVPAEKKNKEGGVTISTGKKNMSGAKKKQPIVWGVERRVAFDPCEPVESVGRVVQSIGETRGRRWRQ